MITTVTAAMATMDMGMVGTTIMAIVHTVMTRTDTTVTAMMLMVTQLTPTKVFEFQSPALY